MFGKCLKHEFRATKRLLVPLFIAMIVAGILAGIFFGVTARFFSNDVDQIASTVGMILSGLASGLSTTVLFALFAVSVVVCFILIIRRFYTSFFTDEGYLTFTLPVSVNTHLFSKFTAAYIWEILSAVVALISVFIIAFLTVLIGGPDLFGSTSDVAEAINIWEILAEAFFGSEANIALSIVLSVVYFIIATAASIFMLYLSIAFACMLAKKYRLIIGIVCYYVISSVFSTISGIIQTVFMLVPALNEDASAIIGVFSTGSLIALIVLSIVQLIVCYLGTNWVLTKKLNLD